MEGRVASLGEKIRTLRKTKGYTIEKLGELTDTSQSYIWQLEIRNPPRPSAEKISRIAAALGVTAEYLLDPEGNLLLEDAADEAFCRRYRKMDPALKKRIRQTVDLWDDTET